MPAGIVRIALGWASFLVLVGGALLFVEPAGTPEFVVTVLTIGLGLLLAALAVGATLVMRRLADRQPHDPDTDAWGPADSATPERQPHDAGHRPLN